jgi:hypothetical protein
LSVQAGKPQRNVQQMKTKQVHFVAALKAMRFQLIAFTFAAS